MTLRRRTFPEVLDNLLTAMTGGSAAEAHPFPPPGTSTPPFQHTLQHPPVVDVVSVYGSRDGQPHLFRKDTDYKLSDAQTLAWQEGAALPDPGTLLQINYYPASAQPTLTDLQTGSVVRTLAETVALEVARLYAQLEVVYQSGFVDTATGSSLDNVVALLGIERVQGGKAAGEIEFTRAPGSRGDITIPAGTRITTADGNVEYETVDTVTLTANQTARRVVARDLEDNVPLPADSLTILPVQIAGILSVTNPAPTTITTQDESDVDLRIRAKNFLHGSERATLGAIKQAIARQGITADVTEVKDTPGIIDIRPHADTLPPELQKRLEQAVEDARPAGVLVRWQQAVAPRQVNLELRLSTGSDLLEQDLRAAQRAVRDKIADYFARLPTDQPGSLNRLVGTVLNIAGIDDVRILSATVDETDVLDRDSGALMIAGMPTVLGELHIADPNLPTRLDVVVTYPTAAPPPDQVALRAALTDMLTYLNEVNASDTVAETRQTLSYGKLLHVTPLPNQPGALLSAYDEAVASGTAPALPDESSITPYTVRFIFTLESGLSRIVSQASGPAYTLTVFERLSLGNVAIQVESDNG
ncbi:MAG TPA: baseplate J/gp47 family protein [Candidatus Tectomicrobia bacterium]